MNGHPIRFNHSPVRSFTRVMTCYYYCLAYKDESTPTTLPSTITASVIDLKPLPPTPSRRTETLHHHQQQQRRPYRKATNKSTLNKTDEHCRSLFNLLPASFRSRHQHYQTSASKGIDAVSTRNKTSDRARQDREMISYIIEWFRRVKWQFMHRSSLHGKHDEHVVGLAGQRERTNWLLFPRLYAIYNSNHAKTVQ